MLHLHFFGPPRIELDGQPVSLDTRKATALLAYLATAGRRHSRDVLATLLYPNFDQGRARAALRRRRWLIGSAVCGAAAACLVMAVAAGWWANLGGQHAGGVFADGVTYSASVGRHHPTGYVDTRGGRRQKLQAPTA